MEARLPKLEANLHKSEARLPKSGKRSKLQSALGHHMPHCKQRPATATPGGMQMLVLVLVLVLMLMPMPMLMLVPMLMLNFFECAMGSQFMRRLCPQSAVCPETAAPNTMGR
mmetsp:Transcript_25683/g.56273  ORF Transcript_25683/g.56273 Transcript_25683/m.56273 type:complete len:112 (+) Transcript_25683:787-1122(+)